MADIDVRETRPFPPPQVQILIVDDEPNMRDIVRRTLVHNGLATLEAASGAEAIEILRARGDGIAAVVTDHRMPNGGAPEIVAWCRDHAPGVAIVCITGSADAIGLGVPVLKKPFEARALLSALRAMNVPVRA